jgi:hypothetical protein
MHSIEITPAMKKAVMKNGRTLIKTPAYAVNPESERAENRDVLTWDLVNSRLARLKRNRVRTAF